MSQQMQDPIPNPVRRRETSDILGETFRTYFRYFPRLVLPALIFLAPVKFITLWARSLVSPPQWAIEQYMEDILAASSTESFESIMRAYIRLLEAMPRYPAHAMFDIQLVDIGFWLIGLVAAGFTAGLLSLVTVATLQGGEAPPMNAILDRAVKLLPSLFGAHLSYLVNIALILIASMLLLFAGAFFTGYGHAWLSTLCSVGSMFTAFYTLFYAVRCTLYSQTVAIEGRPAGMGLARSAALVARGFWKVLLIVVVVVLFRWIFGGIIDTLLRSLAMGIGENMEHARQAMLTSLGSALAMALVFPLGVVGMTVLYLDLVAREVEPVRPPSPQPPPPPPPSAPQPPPPPSFDRPDDGWREKPRTGATIEDVRGYRPVFEPEDDEEDETENDSNYPRF